MMEKGGREKQGSGWEWREYKDRDTNKETKLCDSHCRVIQADGGSSLSTAQPTPVCTLY